MDTDHQENVELVLFTRVREIYILHLVIHWVDYFDNKQTSVAILV